MSLAFPAGIEPALAH